MNVRLTVAVAILNDQVNDLSFIIFNCIWIISDFYYEFAPYCAGFSISVLFCIYFVLLQICFILSHRMQKCEFFVPFRHVQFNLIPIIMHSFQGFY